MTARVRTAHRALLGEVDPALELLAEPATDLRLLVPKPPLAAWPGIIVVSGPDDLDELRVVVERATGVGTWPTPPDAAALAAAGYRPDGRVDVSVPVGRPTAMSGLLLAMEDVIDDRSPWRTWRTAVDTLATALLAIDRLTVQAERWERHDPAT